METLNLTYPYPTPQPFPHFYGGTSYKADTEETDKDILRIRRNFADCDITDEDIIDAIMGMRRTTRAWETIS